jgi:hypothetical protein
MKSLTFDVGSILPALPDHPGLLPADLADGSELIVLHLAVADELHDAVDELLNFPLDGLGHVR